MNYQEKHAAEFSCAPLLESGRVRLVEILFHHFEKAGREADLARLARWEEPLIAS